jgi:hypothetical protein
MRRHIALAALPACALLVVSPFTARAAEDVIEIPAPPASASAVALKLGSLLDISQTGAVAHDTNKDPKPEAEASVLRLNEQVLLGLGGSQEGVGSQGGALIDTGASNPIRLEVAPWATTVEQQNADTVHSNGQAALAKANVANVVKAALLHSESDAVWTKGKSTGTAYSNGVELGIADILSVVLLHSEVNSEGGGNSYLVGLNGTEIGTDSQLGNSELCSLDLSLLALSCLQADGGGATLTPGTPREAAAEVAQVDPALDPLKIIDPVDAIAASSSSGIGSEPIVSLPAVETPPAPALPAAEDSRSPDATAPAALPRTGATIAGSVVSGLVALLGGALLRRTGRRRTIA